MSNTDQITPMVLTDDRFHAVTGGVRRLKGMMCGAWRQAEARHDSPLDYELFRLTSDTDQAAMMHRYVPETATIAETIRRVTYAVARGDSSAHDVTDLRTLLPLAERVDAELGEKYAVRLAGVIDQLARDR